MYWRKFFSLFYIFPGLAEGNTRGSYLHMENILGEGNHCIVDRSLNEWMSNWLIDWFIDWIIVIITFIISNCLPWTSQVSSVHIHKIPYLWLSKVIMCHCRRTECYVRKRWLLLGFIELRNESSTNISLVSVICKQVFTLVTFILTL